MSYNDPKTFDGINEKLQVALLKDIKSQKSEDNQLNVLLLADDRHDANVVQDHINAFRKHSRHDINIVNPIHERIERCCSIEKFDVILIHYSILVLSDYFLPKHNSEMIRTFAGPKAQIIQDECRWINRMKEKMAELGVKAVFSSLNVENINKVYSGPLLKNNYFYSCLPGYIPEYLKERKTLPIKKRPLDIVYRGRDLPFCYGKRARQKSQIANHRLLQKFCLWYGNKIDISAKEETRIYGDDWLNFIASGRATLGVEGGVSLFDFDEQAEKQTERYLSDHPNATFEEVFRDVLRPLENNIIHKTITPRIFEAICLKTALILYPGEYRGLLESGKHYISLSPNGSKDIFVAKKLQNHDYLQEMVDRTYADIVENKELQTSFYVKKVDAVLNQIQTEYRD